MHDVVYIHVHMDVCVMWCIYMFVWMCAWCGAYTCSCGRRHGVPADVCACGLWRTEVDVTCLPPLLSVLFFEIGSPTQPGAQQFREHGWPIGYMNLPVSSPSHHTTIPHLGLQTYPAMPDFYMMLVSELSTLSAEPCPQSLKGTAFETWKS